MADFWVEKTDEEGNSLRTKTYNGRYYAAHFIGNVKDHLNAIDAMDVRDDDTFILSYPKSGTHWLYTIASMLRTGNTSYTGSPDFLDFNEMKNLNNLPSPRLLASHVTFERLPRQVREGKGKILVIFRNPKDVAVSRYAFANKLDHCDFHATWEGFLKFFMEGTMIYGSWFDNVKAWEKTRTEYSGNNVLYLIYEDMKQDLRSHVEKIASFLGTNTTKDYLDQVTKRCIFKNMVTEATKEFQAHDQWKTLTKTKTLPIYRKGEIGDWKNHFTVAQNERFDNIYSENMKGSNLQFRFE